MSIWLQSGQSSFFSGLEKGEKKGCGVWGSWLHGLLNTIHIPVTRHGRRMVLCVSTEDKDGAAEQRSLGSMRGPETAERIASQGHIE